MRDLATIEAELAEISSIQDDTTKLERIIVWAASNPSEIPLAFRFFSGNSPAVEQWLREHANAS